MAFFGLTQMGSQSPFERARETLLHVFDQNDFQHAFLQTWRPGFRLHSEDEDEVVRAKEEMHTSTIRYEQLEQLLRTLYKCPKGVNNVPAVVTEVVMKEFESYEGNEQLITLSEFLLHIQHACDYCEHLADKEFDYSYDRNNTATREFSSNSEYRLALGKHHRMEKNPREKNLCAMTDSQGLGWSQPTIVHERLPKNSCDETKFASAMIQAGVYYY